MSAIVGVYYPDGQPVDQAELGRMVDILAHRGPDGAGVWREGQIGLGHRMLWTTPESLHEQLPLVNRRGDLVITADARIDNRNELISMLGLTVYLPDTISDSEIILAAYERWGERCPLHLLGDFAFAIWDVRQQILFCARDHFGVKPFYYYHRAGQLFAFGSEIKALLCVSGVPQRLNEVRVAEYLAGISDNKLITFYENIFRLLPGHSMTVSIGRIQTREYWCLNPKYELRLCSNEEYAEAYRTIFTEAVHCRLRSAFPMGSMLSGGLDSSSITCVARDLLTQNPRQQLHTFSAIFDDLPQCDERFFINAVLEQGGLIPHYVQADQLNPLHDLDNIFWHVEEPFQTYNLFMHWALWNTIQQKGVRIVLDGFVGDSTVSQGYAYLTDLARTAQWVNFLKHIKGLSSHYPGFFWKPAWFYSWKYGLKPLITAPANTVQHIPGLDMLMRDRHSIVNAELLRRAGLNNRDQTKQDRPGTLQSAREQHYHEITSGEITLALEVVNKAIAAFSCEVRLPFLDRRLVEFCLAIPAKQKLYGGYSRMIVRKALADTLPKEVCWRVSKGNIAPNLKRGLLTFGHNQVEDVVLTDPALIAAYVDMKALKKAYQHMLNGKDNDILSIWLAVHLAQWMRGTGSIFYGIDMKGGAKSEILCTQPST